LQARGLGVVLLASLMCASTVSADAEFRRVAMTGDQAAGTPPGAFFDQFGTFPGIGNDFPPQMDANGNVAFHAVLAGTGVNGVNIDTGNGLGIWKQVGETTSLIARQDDPAPGTEPGVEFRGFTTGLVPEPPAIASGNSVFAGALRGPGVDIQFSTNVNGIWRETQSGTVLAIRAADPAPGLPPGHTVRIIGVPFAAPSTRIMFNGIYAAPGDTPGGLKENQEAFWTDRSGAFEALALGLQQAPDVPAGIVFGEGHWTAIEGAFRSWDTNDALQLAFNGNLSGPGIGALNDEGIWVEQSDAIHLLVREGDPSPAISVGVHFGIVNGIDTFGEVIPIEMNNSGAIVFGARHEGGNIPFTRAIWTTRTGELELVAYGNLPLTNSSPGSPAPGIPDATFSAIPFAELNDANQIAISGFVTINMDFDNQPQGVWWDRPGPLTLVAREDDPVPGLPGIEFAGFNRNLTFGGGGHLSFLADLKLGANGNPFGVALMMTDPEGGLHILVRTDTLFDVAGDGSDLRVVAQILPGLVSNAGEIPMELGFTDGSSGLFVGRVTSPAVHVPLPTSSSARIVLAPPQPNPRAGADPFDLRFELTRPATVRASLYDVTGREVAAREPESFPQSGTHVLRWNPGRLTSGVYFVRLELDSGTTATARCVVLD